MRRALTWLVLVLLGAALHFSGALHGADRWWLDRGFALERAHLSRAVAEEVVIVGIDEAFLKTAREPLALLHRHYAALFEALAAARPKVVGLDIVLPDKSYAFLSPADEPGPDFDRALARGLLRLGQAAPVLVARTWDHARGRWREILPAFLAASGQWVQLRGPAGFDQRGSALVCPDGDGIVREYPGPSCQPDGAARPLAATMAALLGRAGEHAGYINAGIGAPFNYIPGRELIAWQQAGDVARLEQLKDKIVLVGAVLDDEDRLLAPVELAQWEPGSRKVPGVVLQAQIVRSLMNQGLVRPAPVWAVLALIGLGAALLLARGLRRQAALLALFTLAVLALSLLALPAQVFVPPTAALMTAALALLISAALAGRRYWRERQHLRQTFAGSVSPTVLREILAGRIKPDGGEKRRVCVLFSDIRDFTTLSEQLPPDAVVALLNRYFDCMARIVHRHGGTVDKFIGDGLLALFGAPLALPDAERQALAAAQEMLAALPAFNAGSTALGLPPVRVGIGLHTGEAVIGYLGSSERHEYTAIGDAVNVAARVCDLPKKLGHPVVCTEAVAQALHYPPFLREAGEQPLKGRAAMRVYGWTPGPDPEPALASLLEQGPSRQETGAHDD